jgi:hypothetical protein
MAHARFGRGIGELGALQLRDLLAALHDQEPGFFKQLRMDVAAMYLSDADVARRIGFPGPSLDSGGYPDFDQPQTAPSTPPKSS